MDMVLLNILAFFVLIKGYRIPREKIYYSLGSTIGCLRFLDNEKRYGCAGDFDGNSGKLLYVKSIEEIKYLKEKSFLLMRSGLLVDLFTDNMKGARRFVQGVVIYSTDIPNYPSRDSRKPFEAYEGLDLNNFEWNPKGDGLLYKDIKFPILFLYERNETLFTQVKNEKLYARTTSKMLAKTNAIDCLKERTCTPVSGESLIAVSESKLNATNQKYIIIVAPLDEKNMFQMGNLNFTSSYGALAVMLNIIKGFSANETRKMYEKSNYTLMFMALKNERHGLLGSRRFIYDLKNFKCEKEENNETCSKPTLKSFKIIKKLKNIIHQDVIVIDLGELSFIKEDGAETNDLIFYKKTKNNKDTDYLVNKMIEIANPDNEINLKQSDNNSKTSTFFPPSTSWTFIKEGISVLHLADHDGPFLRSDYNAVFNDKFSTEMVGKTSNLLYKALLGQIGITPVDLPDATRQTKRIMECFNLDRCKDVFEIKDKTETEKEIGNIDFNRVFRNETLENLFKDASKNCEDTGKCDSYGLYCHHAYGLGLKYENKKYKVDNKDLFILTWSIIEFTPLEIYHKESFYVSIALLSIGLTYFFGTFVVMIIVHFCSKQDI